MAKKTTPKSKKKKPGRTIASGRRFKYDEGGTRPLTQFQLSPMTVPVPQTTKDALLEMSELFISPRTLKRYGVGAVARVLLQLTIDAIDEAPREELVELFRQTKGLPGRSGFKETVAMARAQILVPMPILDRINARVMALNDPEVATATCIRWLLMRGLKISTHYQLYHFMPSADVAHLEKEKLTIDDVIARYHAAARVD